MHTCQSCRLPRPRGVGDTDHMVAAAAAARQQRRRQLIFRPSHSRPKTGSQNCVTAVTTTLAVLRSLPPHRSHQRAPTPQISVASVLGHANWKNPQMPTRLLSQYPQGLASFHPILSSHPWSLHLTLSNLNNTWDTRHLVFTTHKNTCSSPTSLCGCPVAGWRDVPPPSVHAYLVVHLL